LAALSAADAVDLAAGSSWTNLSCTSASRCSFPTWRVGCVSACHKQDVYRQHGVPWLCFVDPLSRTIEVLKLSGQDLVVAGSFGGDGEMRVPPFDAVAIDVGSLWDSPAIPPEKPADTP